MAILEHASQGLLFLTQDTLLGRSERCTLRIDDAHISRVHALVWWEDERWLLKDLGSDNGTFVDGRALQPGGCAVLELGAKVVLGHALMTVVDTDPPVSATPVRVEPGKPPVCEGHEVTAAGGLLALPPPESPEALGDPQITLYRDLDGRWLVEGDARPLSQGALLQVGATTYQLSLPQPASRTKPLNGLVGHSVGEVELHFLPSQDFEQIELCVALTGTSAGKRFGAHKHNELLWVLAEARSRDPDGWVDDNELLKRAGLESRERLNTEVYRARRQFAGLGLSNPAQIIERRLQTKKTRLGPVQRVVVDRPEPGLAANGRSASD